eukprot:UN34353
MVLVGIGWVIKLQLMLLALLTASIITFFVGCFTNENESEGIVGMSGWTNGNFADNLMPDYREFQKIDYNFFTTFGIFFPAVTGIMAGANISGDLRNPSENIPKGTLWAVYVSIFTYCLMAIFIGA